MQLSDLLRALRRHRWAALLAFAAFLAVSLGAAFLPAPLYRATTTVLVQPDPERAQVSTVQAVEFVMPSLVAVVESRSLEVQARQEVPAPLRTVGVEISAEVEPGTGVLHVSAISSRQEAVAPLADAAADVLAERQPASALFMLDVIDPARVPEGPFSPAKLAILLSGSVLGLFGAVATAVAMAAMRGRVDAAEQIRRRFGATVLGEIPALPRRLSVASSPAELFQEVEHPRVVEAYQRLRANVEFALFSDRTSFAAVTVTSCSVGEGKSTVTANLGWALASSGYQVLLVDGDLRRPVLHEYLGVPFGQGVSAVATTADVNSLIRPSSHPALGVVPAGVPDRHPSEVIGFALPRLLDAHSGSDRLVLVDTPPINSVAETVIAAALTRHVILVVEARRRDLVDLERAVLQLREAGANLLGVVINRASKRRDVLPDDYYFSSAESQQRRRSADGRAAVPAAPPDPPPEAADRRGEADKEIPDRPERPRAS